MKDDIEIFEKMTDDELTEWVEDAKKEAENNPVNLVWSHEKQIKEGDIVVHKRYKFEGLVSKIEDNHAEVYFTTQGRYKPETFHINELEVISESR